jgi:hypothetical protein
MEIWYEAHLTSGIIEKVEVEKFTANNVWVKRGYQYVKQCKREDAYTKFCPTFEEAWEVCFRYLSKKQVDALEELTETQKRLTILGLHYKTDTLPEPPKYDTLFVFTDEMIEG